MSPLAVPISADAPRRLGDERRGDRNREHDEQRWDMEVHCLALSYWDVGRGIRASSPALARRCRAGLRRRILLPEPPAP
ncbi:MAG: hypothetical protein ACHBNF_19600 [Chromatiales bacterium]